MNRAVWILIVATGLSLAGCGGGGTIGSASTTPSDPSSANGTASSTNGPTDFASFVIQQVQTQPSFGTAPTTVASLTTDLAIGNATAFASVNFGTGDAVPAGTFQAVVACTQAGQAACNPSVSADLNSNLN